MAPVPQVVRADPDPVVGVEAARAHVARLTPPAADVRAVDIAAQLGDIFSHEADDRACDGLLVSLSWSAWSAAERGSSHLM